MPIAADFSVDRATKNIRHVSGTATYSVDQLHRWLQDLADDAAASGDDMLDITDPVPSERSTANIITLVNGYNIDDTAAQYLYNGSITQKNGDEIYAGIMVIGTHPAGTQLQIMQNGALISPAFWNSGGAGINGDGEQIYARFMVKVRTGGADIDGRRLVVMARELGNTYAEFPINGTTEGNNVAAITTTVDLNNQTAQATIAGWSTITNVEGYQAYDVDNDGNPEPFYSQWDRAARSMNDLYERFKYLTRRGTSSTLYGLNGFLFRGPTHHFAYNSKAGAAFQQNEVMTWGSGATAGTGRLLAATNLNANGTMWIQLLTGVAPTNGATITGATSTGTADANGTVTAHTPPAASAVIGQSTGTAIIGGYGVGIKPSSLSASDRLTDLSAVTHTPPNLVPISMSGLSAGDRVIVGPWDGSTVDGVGNPVLDTGQMTLQTALTGGAVTSVKVSSPIPADTPAVGTIRVVNNSGYHVRVPYSSWSGDTFVTTGTAFNGSGETANAGSGNGVYVSYIDKAAAGATESVNVIFAGERKLVGRVRNGGGTPIKTFTAPLTLGPVGATATAIRTADQ